MSCDGCDTLIPSPSSAGGSFRPPLRLRPYPNAFVLACQFQIGVRPRGRNRETGKDDQQPGVGKGRQGTNLFAAARRPRGRAFEKQGDIRPQMGAQLLEGLGREAGPEEAIESPQRGGGVARPSPEPRSEGGAPLGVNADAGGGGGGLEERGRGPGGQVLLSPRAGKPARL